MRTILFPSFYTDESEFRAAELYWQRLVEELAHAHGQSGEWVSWRSHAYADGTPYARDGGNVCMLDRCNYRTRRAINVQQWPPSPENDPGSGISAWTSRTHAFVDGAIIDVQELVLNLEMTQETVRVARTLIGSWMDPETGMAALQAMITLHVPGMEQSPGGRSHLSTSRPPRL